LSIFWFMVVSWHMLPPDRFDQDDWH
jgi:hypothetical protein